MLEYLPSDWRQAILVGRLLTRDGPTPVIVVDGRVRDVSRHAPTVSQLLNGWNGDVPSGDDLGTLESLGLTRHFAAIVSSGVVGYEKPHRRLFDEALRHVRPGEEVWMIGDNREADCRPVCALGMKAVLVRGAASDLFEVEAADLVGALDRIGVSGQRA